MRKTVVINAVGLTKALVGAHTPRLAEFARKGKLASVGAVIPALTTTVQSTYLTGAHPKDHGIVGNGWYFRDECEVKFWRQSNALVQGEKIWEKAKKIDPGFTCANCFWWYAMYSGADYTVTPRPMYPADGRKLPDVWTNPPELRQELQRQLGTFPLFRFWGPATSINATDWIARSAIHVDQKFDPTLTLVYLPHMDYVLQKEGPGGATVGKDLSELDAVVGKLIDHFSERKARIIILSEYGIGPVSRPVHLNRVLRQAGLITIREELGRELLDAGASRAFAVADHQIAHVYVNDPSQSDRVRELIGRVPGVATVLEEEGKRAAHLDHPRSGEFVVLAEQDAWFTYYYWLDDALAPDFARTVDIHRKPGYDPAEMFFDPKIAAPKAKIAATLLKRKLGMRALMELTPLDATLVRGSHGVEPASPDEGAMLMSSDGGLVKRDVMAPTDVCDVILSHLTTS